MAEAILCASMYFTIKDNLSAFTRYTSILICHINTIILYMIGNWGILKLYSYLLSFKNPAMTTVPVSYEFRGSCLFLYASLSFSTLLSLKLQALWQESLLFIVFCLFICFGWWWFFLGHHPAQ